MRRAASRAHLRRRPRHASVAGWDTRIDYDAGPPKPAVPMPRTVSAVSDRHVRFESPHSLEASVRRLEAATQRRGFLPPRNEAMIGHVAADRVVLERHIPHMRNAFKPAFAGRFVREGGRTVLAGRFGTHWSVRVFLTFWFGFGAVWTGTAVFLGLAGTARAWLMLPAGPVLMLVGVGIVMLGRQLAQADIAWLSGRIEAALASPGPEAP
ncbi:hypothetical protein LDO32_12620 [Luteimonas sp. Y-2-2-4F]|nr:hypothetical protein [Luteimonas sp. Y-2-2-4F]